MTDNNSFSENTRGSLVLDASAVGGQSRSAPKFSVITITRNDSTGLARTIRSLASQEHRNVEHIIIDGASTDDTAAILSTYSAAYPVVKVSEPDDGIYDAMNKGVALATGDLVVFMNSGDVFGGTNSLSFVSDEYIAGDWRWGFGCMRYVDDSGKRISGQIQAPFNRNKLFLGLSFVPHQAMYMELSLLNDLGPFSLDVGIAADQDMAIRAALAADPAVWVEFLTDFLVGGAHAHIGRWQREHIYHRIRARQHILLGNNRFADYSVTGAIAAWRTARDGFGSALRRRRSRAA